MRYHLFGRTGLRVSQLALGTGNFGKGWGYGSDAGDAEAIYRAYRAAGGNLIDTADQYQFGQSESLLGGLIAGERDELVLASKYSLGDSPTAGLQRSGNSRKAMRLSVEASLKRLRTDYLDLLWVHMPDGVTPIEEILRGMDDLARAGKILHAGLSDFPAWRIAAAATLADLRATLPIAAVQLEYSLVERSAERELLPMAAAFGMAAMAWSPLGGGLLTGKYRQGESGRAQGLGVVIHGESDARKTATLDAVLAIAEELGASAGQVAIAWVLHKGTTLPILGPRTPQQLADNLGALALNLSPEQVARLDTASAISLGFPHDIVAGSANSLFGGQVDRVERPRHGVR
jgi:aryl-alcohol dehydrogenase-like predicted oxidoreductase